jgi:hypothetical protein
MPITQANAREPTKLMSTAETGRIGTLDDAAELAALKPKSVAVAKKAVLAEPDWAAAS